MLHEVCCEGALVCLLLFILFDVHIEMVNIVLSGKAIFEQILLLVATCASRAGYNLSWKSKFMFENALLIIFAHFLRLIFSQFDVEDRTQ